MTISSPPKKALHLSKRWGEDAPHQATAASESEPTSFITVDLDVFSRARLRFLAEALGNSVIVLYEGRWGSRYSANFELADSWQLTADQEIRRFVRLLEALPPGARRLWDRAQSRVFNIGVQAGVTPHAHELKIGARTVASVARLGGTIAVTTYAPGSRPLLVPTHPEDGGL